MSTTQRSISTRLILVGLITFISIVAISLSARGIAAKAAAAPAAIELSAPLAPAATNVITLTPTDDARAQGGSPPTQTFPSGFLYFSTLNGHLVFIQFDLLDLPVNATINAAELRLEFTSVLTGPNGVNVGRAESPWDETTLTWPTAPIVTWGNLTQTVSLNGPYSWNVTGLVNQWHTGASPNYGFGMRGNGGPLVAAHSKETAVAPKLIITYTVPDPTGARPDLGDAPDSTNHVGITNTAYPGVDGRFPTVWSGTPITQPAGPRHANQTMEGFLGDHLSRENEADTGPDEDAINNILNGGTNNGNNDRGDDGWRNRKATFNHCEPTTLKIRVSKGLTTTLNKMYLNVWFDGTHDGDWNDHGPCLPQGEQLQIPSTEWIVQDYIVDMTGIAPGGFADITINTETVLNTSPDKAHWLRFTLSEARAVQSGGRADGRGPNPANGSYQFGETEDYLQKPHPGGETGTLEILKSVTTPTSPTPIGGLVTYEIQLKHVGGSQPIQAQIWDELAFGFRVLPQIVNSRIEYVIADSATGGAAPLEADYELEASGSPLPIFVVKWNGSLDPDSEITLSFLVQNLGLCQPNQTTQTVRNIARARPLNSTQVITDEATFTAACPGYNGINVDMEWVDPITPSLTITDTWHWINYSGSSTEAKQGGTEAKTEAIVTNKHPISVSLLISRVLTTSLPGSSSINLPGLEKITLAPSQTQLLDYGLHFSDLVTDELNLTDDFTAVQRLKYCILPGPNATQCPPIGLFPQLHGQSRPLTITVRPHDLGDAPDSTNHAGAAMTAYPAVQANYPTVYDPALGVPIGPLHRHPRPFHLGQSVSREAEADLGPDEDALNNIRPAANDPDNDRFDDGIRPDLWALNNCQTTNVPVKVFITPQAVNYFQQLGTPGYINIWLDANRDGDWADGFPCGGASAEVEHIVIDRAVNVVALGAGLHTINVATGLIPWPAQWAQQPTWVRITLSDRPSNKPLNFGGINYGDGRGFALPFRTGETEDYYARPEGVAGAGPDMGVRLNGRVEHGAWQVIGPYANLLITVTEQIQFKIDYANVGSRPANNPTVVFHVPTQLQHQALSSLSTARITPTSVISTNTAITFTLPAMLPGDDGTIVLGWGLYPGIVEQAETYTGTARVSVAGDIDLSNNQDTVAVTPEVPEPIVLARVLNSPTWSAAGTTCRTTVNFVVRGIPGQTVQLLLDGQPAGTGLLDEEGLSYFLLSNLSSGRHRVQAQYINSALRIMSPRDSASGLPTGVINVDPSLPIDPLSLTFTDSQGRSIQPSTLNWSWGMSQTGTNLKSGETYEVGVNSCSNALNQNFKFTFEDIIVSSLRDDDGDGRYTGSFTYNPIVQLSPSAAAAASVLRFSVISGGVQQNFDLNVQPLVSGIVRDALTQQPIANASLALLGAPLQAGVKAIFSVWPSAALGQPNPQTTGVDGAYSFNTPGSLNRVEAIRSGYQLYRSWNLIDDNGTIAQDIDLTPAITGKATYTIFITDRGFEPAMLKVKAGSSVEWVNVDLAEHTTTNAAWDSGVLSAGQRYQVKLNAPGTYTYADNANAENMGVIVVEANRLYLPLVLR